LNQCSLGTEHASQSVKHRAPVLGYSYQEMPARQVPAPASGAFFSGSVTEIDPISSVFVGDLIRTGYSAA
jgi:hypothetical protein